MHIYNGMGMEFVRDETSYFIRLEKGEEIFACLMELAIQQNWQGGHLSGIGAVEDVVIGAFNTTKRGYVKKDLPDEYELLGLEGNLSWVENEPFFHIHTVLSDQELNCLGGHLFQAKVAVTCEINFRLFPKKIDRKWNDQIGLNLLDMCPMK